MEVCQRTRANLTSRVTIKDNATFVIRNFTHSDSTKYRCILTSSVGMDFVTDPVEVVVGSKYNALAVVLRVVSGQFSVIETTITDLWPSGQGWRT